MPDQPIIAVRCRECSAILRLKSVPQPGQTITCPACKNKRSYTDYIPVRLKPRPKQPAAPRPGMIVFKNKTYPLAAGINTVGRMAASSAASVQLPDESHYMSREHLIIETTLDAAGQTVHTVALAKDFIQPTAVNGRFLAAGEKAILAHGDRISICPAGVPAIEIVFHLPQA